MIEDFAPEPDLDIRLKRARMRAWRRGMREMDLILGGFIDAHGEGMTAERLESFEGLLSCRDQDLYAWVSGRDKNALTGVASVHLALLAEIAANWRVIDENFL